MPEGGNNVNIDSIMLEINSNAKGATDSIDAVCGKLGELKAAIGGMTGKAQVLRNLANAMSVMSKSKVNLTPLISQLGDFSKLDLKGTGLSQFVGNLGKLNSATKGLDIKIFGDFAEEMKKMNDVSSSSTELLKAVNSLTRSSEKMKEAAANFPALSAQILEFFDSMSNVTVSDNTVMMAQGLADIARYGVNANAEMKRFSQSATKSQTAIKLLDITIESIRDGFKMLGKILISLTNGIKNFAGKAVEGVKSLASKIKEMTSQKGGIDTLHFSLKSLLTTLIGFRGITGIFSWTMEAVKAGGDLTEINHIVESMYGDMSDAVKSWADTMLDNYGIASMEAKKYAGTLTAMAKASGIATKEATQIGIGLTEAAGDISAFFNIETADAYKKLQAGLAGQVRPLRQLGIDLQATTLKQYAMDQGIQKSYADMTQAEKIMLRYDYIMKVLSSDYEKGIGVLGDYERTQYSYANSLRKLSAYMNAIKTQIGAGITAALRPAIVALNVLMEKLLKAAKAFTVFMQTLFPFQNGSSGMALADSADYADELADGTENAADGLEDASDAAKKLKKDLSVLPFDELNQLAKDKELASTSTKSVGGTDALPSIDMGGMFDWEGFYESLEDTKLPDAIDAWASRIKGAFERHNWKLLGTTIANGINTGIDNLYRILDPETVDQKLSPYISAFTTTMNSLVSGVNFEKLGGAIGEGMTIVFNAANQFMRDFDWHTLGVQLGKGANGLIKAINWKSLGDFFALKLNTLWQTAEGFVSTFNWSLLGTSLATGSNAFVDTIDFESMVNTISGGLNGIASTLEFFALHFKWRQLGETLASNSNLLIAKIDLYKLGKSIGTNFTQMFGAIRTYAYRFNWTGLGKALGLHVNGLNDGISWSKVAEALTASLNGAFRTLRRFAATVDWTKLVTNITGGINRFIRLFNWEENGKSLNLLITNLITALINIVKRTDWKGLGEGIATMIQEQKWVELLPEAAKAIMDALGGLLEGMGKTPAGKIVAGLVAGLTAVTLVGKFDKFVSRIATVITGEQQQNVVGGALSSLFTKALARLAPVLTPIAPQIALIAGAVASVKIAISNIQPGDLPEISEKVSTLAEDCTTATENLNSLKTDGSTALSEMEADIRAKSAIAQPLINKLQTLAEKTGALTEAEKKEKTDAIDMLIAIYPDLNGQIDAQNTNLSSVVATLKEYITKTEALARSQVYFEQIKKEVEGQVAAEQSLEAAQKAREPIAQRMNFYDREKKRLAEQIATQLGVDVTAYENLDQAIEDNAGSFITWRGETKPVGDFLQKLYELYGGNALELATLDSAISENKKSIAESQSRIEQYTGKLSAMEETTGKVSTSTEKVSGKLGTYATNVSDASSKTGTLNGNVDAAKTKLDSLTASEKTAAEKAKSLSTEASKAATNIKTQGENADTAEGYVSNYNTTNEKTPSLFASVSKMLGGVLTTLLASYGTKSDFEGKLKEDVEGAETGIKDNSHLVEDAAKTMGQNTADAIDSYTMQEEFKSAGENDAKAVGTGMQNAQLDSASIASGMLSGMKGYLEGLTGEYGTAWWWGRNIADAIANGLKSVKLPIPKFSQTDWSEYKLDDNTSMWLPVFSSSWEIPWYAKGGLFTNPSIVGVGEAGKETVLPLENKRTMGMIADAIIDNSNGIGIDEETLASAVARGYVQAMMANQGNQQQPIYNIVVKTENDEVLARAVQRGNQALDYRNNPTPKLAY